MPLPLTQMQIGEPQSARSKIWKTAAMPLKFRTQWQQMNESRDKWMNVFDNLLQFFKAPWVVRAPPLSHANPQCHLWCLRWQVLSSGRVFHRKSSWHLPNLAVILFHIGLLTLWLESWWTLPSVKKLSRCLFHPFSSFTIFVHLIILVFRIQCPRLPKR